MRRDHYFTTAEYGYACGYHLAGTNTISDAVIFACDLPSHQRDTFYAHVIHGAFAYYRDAKQPVARLVTRHASNA